VLVELGQDRLPQLTGAKLYGEGGDRADNHHGHAAVAPEYPFLLEGLGDGVEGVGIDLGCALGLELGFDGIERVETNVGEGASNADECARLRSERLNLGGGRRVSVKEGKMEEMERNLG